MKVPQRPSAPRIPPVADAVRQSLRLEIPAAQNWAYFDHAAVSPLPQAAVTAASDMLRECATSGDVHWPDWSAAAGRLRSHASELLHCPPAEIALVPNTTFGINLIANTFPWFGTTTPQGGFAQGGFAQASIAPGPTSQPIPGASPARRTPNVVVVENEFSSNLLAWENLANYGIEVRKVRVDPTGIVSLDRIREQLDSQTRLVSISWVNYLTGYRIDLAKVCELVHSFGAQLFLDAIQGLGVFPCDVSQIPIDYVAADGHKWLLGPEGAGLLYIRDHRLPELAPAMLGWNSLRGAHHFNNQAYDFKQDASRFEGGSANHVGLIALEKSLRLLLDLGCHLPDNGVAQAVLENAAAIQLALEECGAEVYRDAEMARRAQTHLSGIITFNLPDKDPAMVRSELIRNKVICSVRHARVRLATHAYNTTTDIEMLVRALKSIP